MSGRPSPRPAWAVWKTSEPYTLGVEEEVMLLDPDGWALAQRSAEVMDRTPAELTPSLTPETHGSAIELKTRPHATVAEAGAELFALRSGLRDILTELDLAAAAAGTHPSAVWSEISVSSDARYQFIYGSMRELARREPTFALHVHVGVATPQEGIDLYNRMRGHLPLLLALSVNSPFWQGRDTGLASARTPLFQAFPRVGMPRRFTSYEDFVETVDLLVRCEAFPDHTFLWWDVRPQPPLGTVEVRIMDVQTTVEETAALVALVQSISRLELEEGWVSTKLISTPEVLIENRFIAARDGMEGALVDPEREARIPAGELLARLLDACAPHAEALGCTAELAFIERLAEEPGAQRQIEVAHEPDKLPGLVRALSERFVLDGRTHDPHGHPAVPRGASRHAP